MCIWHHRRCTKISSVRKLANARVRNFYAYEIFTRTKISAITVLKITSPLIGWLGGDSPNPGVSPRLAQLPGRTLYIVEILRTEAEAFRFRSSNGRKMHAAADRHRRLPRCREWKTACSSRTTLAWPCTIHYDQFWQNNFERYTVSREPKCQAVLISPFIFFWLMCNFFWKPRGDRTENHSMKSVIMTRRQQKHCQRVLQRKISQTWAWSFATLVIRWSEIKTWYLRGFELSISNTETKDCSWAETQVAVGLWVVGMYGYFSLSTIEKRANCVKNNRPKTGWLFLVNTRPFPEHSSSIATLSAGRAWLEAKRFVASIFFLWLWPAQLKKIEKKTKGRFCILFFGMFWTECWGLGASFRNWFRNSRSNGIRAKFCNHFRKDCNSSCSALLLFFFFFFFDKSVAANKGGNNSGSIWSMTCSSCARWRVVECSNVGIDRSCLGRSGQEVGHLASRRGRWKKFAPTATKKETFFFCGCWCKFFSTPPSSSQALPCQR